MLLKCEMKWWSSEHCNFFVIQCLHVSFFFYVLRCFIKIYILQHFWISKCYILIVRFLFQQPYHIKRVMSLLSVVGIYTFGDGGDNKVSLAALLASNANLWF